MTAKKFAVERRNCIKDEFYLLFYIGSVDINLIFQPL